MLSAEEVTRYSRQILLPELGRAGQEKIKNAKILCVGAGGLGSPAALYLAGAGVGLLGLADGDAVEPSNLHRQILHGTADIGRPKTASAREKLAALNPHVSTTVHDGRITAENAPGIFAGYDLILDGSDNFETRYVVNDACVRLKKILVSGAVVKWEGQLLTVRPGRGPCYRCVFPEPPEAGCGGSCAEAGVLGPWAGVVGSWIAGETLKVLLGLDSPGTLFLLDFRTNRFRSLSRPRRKGCAACGDAGPEAVSLTKKAQNYLMPSSL